MENAAQIGLFGAAGAAGRSIAHALSVTGRRYRVIGRGRAALVGGEGVDENEKADDQSFRLMVESIDALKAEGRLPGAPDSHVCAEAFWATMHGIVALHLTCPVFPRAPLDAVVDAALVAWFGANAAQAEADVNQASTTDEDSHADKPPKPRRGTASKAKAQAA